MTNTKLLRLDLNTVPKSVFQRCGWQAFRKPGDRPPNASLRVPATRANRAYLRVARRAELLAWQAASRTSPNAELRAELANLASDHRKESRLLIAVALIATVAVGAGMAVSFRFVDHWPDFTAFVRGLLG